MPLWKSCIRRCARFSCSRLCAQHHSAVPCTIRIPASQSSTYGRSGLICGSREAAGGHYPRGGGIRPPEEVRAEFQRPVSISFRKDALVFRESDEAILLLLWVRRGRGRF